MAVQQNTSPQVHVSSSNPGTTIFSFQSTFNSLNPTMLDVIVVFATAVIVSVTVYLLLRCISVYRRRRSSSVVIASDSLPQFHGSDRRIDSVNLIDSLPLFTFSSLTDSTGGDCAVCLSKFEPQDQLRLLPTCCHAFHAECIDTWLATNQTCPLCRSSIFVSESELMSKTLGNPPPTSTSRNASFRVEIGSVSRNRNLPSGSTSGNIHRSYSIGSFDYLVDDVVSEITISSIHGRSDFTCDGDKSRRLDESAHPSETLTAEVSAGGGERVRNNWLKDYVDMLARTTSFSLASSFRSSGRFFTGSSRITDESRVHEMDLEASRFGDEISEVFRWLSGM